jgi:ABC-2 type transport system ATP-binding protein
MKPTHAILLKGRRVAAEPAGNRQLSASGAIASFFGPLIPRIWGPVGVESRVRSPDAEQLARRSFQMIQVEKFSKTYESNLAVDDLSFDVDSGSILGLVGPNGSGKTTTLRVLAGVILPSSGTLRVAGHDIASAPLEAKRRLAFIPDVPHLFENLTVWEHLEFTARIYQLPQSPGPNWKQSAEELLAEFELHDQREKMADQLSLGMRQKVVMCCALLHEPKVMLLDEPLTGLDPRGIRTLYRALEQRASMGASIVLSTHLLGQIGDLCDRFLILKEGRRIAYGTSEDIHTSLPTLEGTASLEEIFFEATEGGAGTGQDLERAG